MMYKITWMNTEEYEQLKEEINKFFPFARVIRNNQKYAMGGFNIRPKANQNYQFTEEQVELIINWLINKDLMVLDTPAKKRKLELCSNGEPLYKLANKDGFTYITKYEEVI